MAQIDIFEVDLVQTPSHSDNEGSLYVEMEVEEQDITRIHANVPVSLYETWEERDFDLAFYQQHIEKAYPYREETDEE